MERRLYRVGDFLRALSLAPIAALVVAFVASLAAIFLTGTPPILERSTPIREALQIPAIVAPYAYVLTVLVGGALTWRANRRARLLLSGESALIGFVLGLVASVPGALFISGPHYFVPMASLFVAIIGGLAGAVTGLLFAVLLNAA